MFLAFLGFHSYCKIGMFRSSLAKKHRNFTSIKKVAKTVEGSLRTYLGEYSDEEPPKHPRSFSYMNIMKLIKSQVPKEKVELTLLELVVKFTH